MLDRVNRYDIIAALWMMSASVIACTDGDLSGVRLAVLLSTISALTAEVVRLKDR